MRSCQLCGVKSWGPVKDKSVLEDTVMAGHPGVEPDAKLLECDGCGALAREDLIAEPVLFSTPNVGTIPTIPGLAPFSGFGPPSIDYTEATRSAQAMLQNMGIAPKTPETRTERLVRSMLELGSIDQHSAKDLVKHAREIEQELDHGIEGLAEFAPVGNARPRDFQRDFLVPCLELARRNGMSLSTPETMISVSQVLPLALDCAIAFGALEGQTTNASLKLSNELESLYWDKVQRLHNMVY